MYCNLGLSTLLFAPHWMRNESYRYEPLRFLNVDLQKNHRFWYYMTYLNRRTLFHCPMPENYIAEFMQGIDVGRLFRRG